MVSSPKPPSPTETAAAQAGMNRDTAISQQQINMVDQFNPWGSVTYDRTGEDTFTDSQGRVISTPTYSQTTQFTPEQQAIFDQGQTAQTNLAGLAADQSGRMREYLNEPFQFNNQDAADWSYDLASSRILPQQERNQEALRTQLVNQGIRPGTAAWDAEMSRLTNANTDQLNQLALTGRSQAFNEAMQTRAAPINELSALLSGSQVGSPASQSGPTPQASVAGVDYTGLVNQQYQAQVSNQQNAMGGLFGLAAAGVKAIPWSDRRLKTDIRRVGMTEGGTPIYTYRYKWGGPTMMGVMAQDVPEARQKDPSGFYRVDYGKVS